ncbi:MAG: DDE-type integrase/transposase/recombinase [Christensenellaceae bacterium]|jgi:transposase InsO family protein/transposase-like protein|nr:DDE-type integrase/transposase/recombinase [Christensenellaceae bacterium]
MLKKKFNPKQKEKAVLALIKGNVSIHNVCKKYKCSRFSLWRWKHLYDGTQKSLENKSQRPLTPHPNSQTQEEMSNILTVLDQHPTAGYLELWGILKNDYNYTRHYMTLIKYIRKNNLRPFQEKNKYIPQRYDTPIMLARKFQLDVKYVPLHCYKNNENNTKRYYQYTIIDEATRERFMHAYTELSAANSCNFIHKAINYFGYIPDVIQTDNGSEFTNSRKRNSTKIHMVDALLNSLNIKHQLTKPYTPRHNGKVERSHRKDNLYFYKYLTFTDIYDLNRQLYAWRARYNKIPLTVFKNEFGKSTMQSPVEKRIELLNKIKLTGNVDHVRFVNN